MGGSVDMFANEKLHYLIPKTPNSKVFFGSLWILTFLFLKSFLFEEKKPSKTYLYSFNLDILSLSSFLTRSRFALIMKKITCQYFSSCFFFDEINTSFLKDKVRMGR